MTIDLIIPVYKPDQKFLELMDNLLEQTATVQKVIIVNTEKKYFNAFIREDAFMEKYPSAIILHVTEQEFNHGGSRNLGVSVSEADSFLIMTQDALPADNRLIEHLLKSLEDEKTAVAYGRQVATEASDELERFIRSFNYPEEACRKTMEDIPRLGIKTYFCSNVCAAYKAGIFKELGGFPEHVIFNEDMIFASRVIKAGYAVQYVPEARVFHSHDYSGMQQFRRNFDLGVSHADYPEVFGGLSSESEGIRMIKKAAGHLIKKGKPWLIGKLIIQSASKYAGFFGGKRYRKFSRKWIMRFTMNRNYWNNT